jgi:hypothetical protein
MELLGWEDTDESLVGNIDYYGTHFNEENNPEKIF